METSRVARTARFLGFAALALFVLGPASIQLLGVDGFVGFRIFGLGILLGLLAFLLGVLGLFLTRSAAGNGGGGPAINDITTNLDDPPAFTHDPSGEKRDMSYPADFVAQQRAGYPDLAPIELAMSPGAAHEKVIELFERNGWQITHNDPVSLTLEATDTTRLFHFVDDIAVRVRPQGAGAVVDMRSKSRVGKGDLGANAKRIRQLRDQLKSSS